MIFTSVNKLNNKTQMTFFREQVNVYIRFVECYCEKNNVPYEVDESTLIENELIEMGVIEESAEIGALAVFLGADYLKFEKAVRYVVENRGQLRSVVGKLYNSERNKIQKEAALKKSMTLVDFFCGAGGLSLGFLQEGFQVKLANDIEEIRKKGEILIECELLNSTLHIKISDFGVGINNVEEVLQPFFTSKPFEERAGMGFTIMRTFMDRFEISSKPNVGTTVSMVKHLEKIA